MTPKLNTLVRKLMRLYERRARKCVTYLGDGIGDIRTFVGQSPGGRFSAGYERGGVLIFLVPLLCVFASLVNSLGLCKLEGKSYNVTKLTNFVSKIGTQLVICSEARRSHIFSCEGAPIFFRQC